jgi:hypothetical protein
MDASRGDLIGVLADPLGHEPEPPGGVDTAMLQNSIVVSRRQKLAADEIDAAIRHVRDEHDSLTVTMTGQRMRLIDRIETLAADMDGTGPEAGPAGP